MLNPSLKANILPELKKVNNPQHKKLIFIEKC